MRRSNSSARRIAGSLIAIVCLLSSSAMAGSAPPLRFNPFRKPPDDAKSGSNPSDRRDSSDAFSPVLRSTLVGDSRALVNLGGELLAVGEEAHGYKLIEIGLYEAVFEKAGSRVTLEVTSGEGVRP